MISNQSIETVRSFIKDVLKNRSPSHGVDHAEKVVQLVCEFLPEMTVFQKQLSIICALLHDVEDHKYKYPVKGSVLKFLKSVEELAPHAELIVSACSAVSFSKETARIAEKGLVGNELFFAETFGENAVIRQIVSDCDKLEAIGKAGLDRCREYTLEHQPMLSEKELREEVIKHFNEKLGKVKSFIRTPAAKKRAEVLHAEMIRELKVSYDYEA